MQFSPFVSGGPSYWLQDLEVRDRPAPLPWGWPVLNSPVPAHSLPPQCQGDEARVEDCGHSPWGDTSSCSSYDAVSITCTPPCAWQTAARRSGNPV